MACCTPHAHGWLPQTPERVRDLWRRLEALPPSDPLPADLPAVLYGTDDDAPAAPTATAPTLLGSTLQCAMYAQLLQPYLARFPTDRWVGSPLQGLGRTGSGQGVQGAGTALAAAPGLQRRPGRNGPRTYTTPRTHSPAWVLRLACLPL